MKSRILRDLTLYEIFGEFTQTYELKERISTFGRYNCDLELTPPSSDLKKISLEKYERLSEIYRKVSRLHAEIFLEADGTAHIVNKSKKNVIFIERQGEKFLAKGKEQLFEGDVIYLQDYKFRLEFIDQNSKYNLEKKLSEQETTLV